MCAGAGRVQHAGHHRHLPRLPGCTNSSLLPSSLVAQLRQLQMLIAQTSNKAAQTSTCVLVPPAHFPSSPSPLSPILIPQLPFSSNNDSNRLPFPLPSTPFLYFSHSVSVLLVPSRSFSFLWLSSSCPASAPFRACQKLGLRNTSLMEVRGKGKGALLLRKGDSVHRGQSGVGGGGGSVLVVPPVWRLKQEDDLITGV